MDKTTTQNLAEVSGLLEQAVGTIRSGEDFPLDFADDCLYSLGAVVELARLSGADQESLGQAEAFLAGVSQRLDDEGKGAFTGEDLEDLQALQDLARAGRAVAEELNRGLYVLVNPVHWEGNAVVCENDRGVYEDPWEAMADLAGVKRYAGNPHIYLAAAAMPPYPECGEGAVAPARQATYDRLVSLAWEALDKLDVADGIVDAYEDGTPFCAGLCEKLRALLGELDDGGGVVEEPAHAEAVVLYAPGEGEVLIVGGEVVDTCEGVVPGFYLDDPHDFFDYLGRALGIRFSVQVVEVDPCALAGEYWEWEHVALAWLSGRAGQGPGG